MTRRGGFELKYIVLVGGGLFFLIGFYSYHSLNNKLRITEELLEQSRAQHDSVAAQLEVVYEHKNRIQTNLEKEKLEHQKRESAFVEKNQQFDTCSEEKSDLQKTIDGINQQNKMWQSQNEDLQDKVSRCEDDLKKK
jgi:flagellar biosynthesis regulator FlaF